MQQPELVGNRIVSVHRSQDHALRSCWNVGPFKVRVQLHVDSSYFYQSRHLRADVWKPNLGWTEAASLHWSEADQGREDAEQRLLRLEQKLLNETIWLLEAE